MPQFVGCPGCSRHVRVQEVSCPFCSSVLAPRDARRGVGAALGSALLFGGCVAAGPDPAGPDGAAPLAGDAATASDASDASDASLRVGDSEETFVPVYGAPGCDFAPDGAETSPMLGGAVVAVAAVAMLRRRRSPSS